MRYSSAVPYAMDFVSFVLEHLEPERIEAIRAVILFGSGARGELRKKSDIDIFFEASGELSALESEIERYAEDFYASVKYRDYWKLKGSTQHFSCHVGNADVWKSLYPALVADGIVLYGKYASSDAQGKTGVLFFWDTAPTYNKRINLFRTLYGYRARGKTYPGLLGKAGGEKLTRGCILVPLESHKIIDEFFKKLGVAAKKLFAAFY
ncbi:MAG: nucleotidyltransferase domain-containing protein [Candidatus Eremiobacteraeota bacterium]|nr:nucleotidyltransferase domain-containing protein [Candidatus Eremiobacteraeota bacterium]